MKYRKRPSSIGCAFNSEAIERMLEMKFKKKPVEIEARRFNEDGPGDAYQLVEWIGDSATIAPGEGIAIKTLEGTMLAVVGDWIIKGVEGEFYPCKDSVFLATYERTYND